MNRRMSSLLTLVAALLLLAPLAPAETHHVGLGPGHDHTSIGAALTAAAGGDTILVNTGTYSGPENRGLDFGDRDIALIAESGATQTIIDCEGVDRALEYHLPSRSIAVVDGFTIRNGFAETGGGIRCEFAAPEIRNCRFEHCTATGSGGALWSSETDTLRLVNCTFSANTSGDCGGAVYAQDAYALDGHVILVSSSFEDNSAGHYGGGVATCEANVTAVACEFKGNSAGRCGGGGYLSLGKRVTMSECRIEGNSANNGGGMHIHARWYDGYSEIDHCVFHANTAYQDYGACHSQYVQKFWECVFTGNVARDVCALGVKWTTILNCSFALNECSGEDGCAIQETESDQSELIRSIVAFSAESCALKGFVDSQVMHCCFHENDGGHGGYFSSVYTDDPLFCGVGNGDVTLCANSPCRLGGYPWGAHIGALGVGCGDCDSPVTPMSWGAIKALYR